MELCSRWVGVDLLEGPALASARLPDDHELTYGKSYFGFALRKRSLIMMIMMTKGIFFDWIGRMDDMDFIGSIGRVG